jgi:sulfide:quinone oxidoreductase
MGEKAVRMMDRMFDSLGIRVYTGKKITEFESGTIVLEDGTRLEADLLMFIPAGDGHTVIKASDLPQSDAGFVDVLPTCEVNGHPWLYAVGDVAALEGPDWRAKQGHIAEIMAQAAAADISRKEGGRDRAKDYVEHLRILCVMDMGSGAGFVYRDDRRALFVPLPIVGHWLKKGWALYYRLRNWAGCRVCPGCRLV